MNITPVQFPAEHIAFLKDSECYTDEEVTTIALHQGMYEAQNSAEAGQIICEFVGGETNTKLTFDQWYDGDLYAKNQRGVAHVIIGSWLRDRFLLQGCVKRRGKGRFTWLINGQASTGSVQVKHFAEQASVDFPEFGALNAKFNEALEAAGQRRADKV